jgi:hypothetical protein
MACPAEHNVPFFHGLQPRWLRWNRLYRIYMSNGAIAAAYVAGEVYDARSARVQLQGLYPFLSSVVTRRLTARKRREAFYDRTDPWSADFLLADPRNFRITRSEVLRSRMRRNRSLWTPDNLGSWELEMVDGKTRRFIVIGGQDQERICELLRVFDRRVEITGSPPPRRKPATPGQRKLAKAVMFLTLSAFGCWFGAIALFGKIKPALRCEFCVLAMLNFAVAAWMLIRGHGRQGKPRPQDAGQTTNRGPT